MKNINLLINWPTTVVFIAILSLIGSIIFWSISIYYQNKRWTTLYAEVTKGCANPDNHLATISIVLDHGQAWSCTPFYRQRVAPKAPKKPGKVSKK